MRDGDRALDPFFDGEVRLVGSEISGTEVRDLNFGMPLLDDPRQCFPIRKLIALNEGVAEEHHLRTIVAACRLRLGRGATSAAPVRVAGNPGMAGPHQIEPDRKSTRLNSSHLGISYAVFCLKKKKK